ncbi:MAG: shikimate kinase [Cellulomonadaceae bacterium]|jgi:shikimate kinase|nr:shikimate kinase [Cellulomonadaceae bacterium]
MTTAPLVVLIGPAGAGKTSVGRALAAQRNVTFRDTDADVAATEGKSVAEIFRESSWAYFRSLEQTAVADALATHEGVLALGGGALTQEANRLALDTYRNNGGTVVYLSVSPEAVAERIGNGEDRPLLFGDPVGKWKDLMAERHPVYSDAANLELDTSGRTAEETADILNERLR